MRRRWIDGDQTAGFLARGFVTLVELSGKVVVVTGGAVRLGRAIALGLAREGASLCVHYGSSQAEAGTAVAEIQRAGGQAMSVQADLIEASVAARRIISAAVDYFGRVDILVNSAAIFEAATLAETTDDHFDRHVQINLKAPLMLCREFARLESPEPRQIVNIADWRATRPQPGHLSYTLSKAALVAMTRILACELAPQIQVNAVAPGAILPPPGAPDAYLERLRDQIPLRRTGNPQDVVDAVRYLLTSDFVTGEVLHVSGGEHL